MPVPQPIVCSECSQPFQPKRLDKRFTVHFCSTTCRVKYHSKQPKRLEESNLPLSQEEFDRQWTVAVAELKQTNPGAKVQDALYILLRAKGVVA